MALAAMPAAAGCDGADPEQAASAVAATTAAVTVTALRAVMLELMLAALLAVMRAAFLGVMLAVMLVRHGIRKGRIVTSLPFFAAAAAFG